MENNNLRLHYQNIFSCDHAQLPEESFIQEDAYEFSNNYSTKIQINSEFYETIKQDFFTAPSNLKEETPQSKYISSVVPNVILISSNSQSNLQNNSLNADEILLQAPIEFNPYERPISRRGSRDLGQEERIEEENNQTETPAPLGDQLEVILKNKQDEINNLNNTKRIWYSDSEGDSDEVEIYYPLENDNISDNEAKTALKNPMMTNNNVKLPTKRFPIFKSCETTDTEDELDINAETKILDRHNYQRLQESPLPPSNMKNFQKN